MLPLTSTARNVIDEPAGTVTPEPCSASTRSRAPTRYSMPDTPALSLAESLTLVPPERVRRLAAVVVGATASVKWNVAAHVIAAAFFCPETDGWK